MIEGLVNIADYKNLLNSKTFLEMESFSNSFIAANKEVLSPYSKKWVQDPFHQWSRQWEYPFVFEQIQKYAGKGIDTIKILDAGSGMTFFPYCIQKNFPESILTCCDTDPDLAILYKSVDRKQAGNTHFIQKDLQDTGLESDFDIIYCISVLEHTKNYDKIAKEFSRLLKNGGLLIVTIDISLDGRSEIEIDRVEQLLNALVRYFSPTDMNCIKQIPKAENLSSEIVTTQFIHEWNKSLLPWRYPLCSSIVSSLRNLRFPDFKLKSLTFACVSFRKTI